MSRISSAAWRSPAPQARGVVAVRVPEDAEPQLTGVGLGALRRRQAAGLGAGDGGQPGAGEHQVADLADARRAGGRRPRRRRRSAAGAAPRRGGGPRQRDRSCPQCDRPPGAGSRQGWPEDLHAVLAGRPSTRAAMSGGPSGGGGRVAASAGRPVARTNRSKRPGRPAPAAARWGSRPGRCAAPRGAPTRSCPPRRSTSRRATWKVSSPSRTYHASSSSWWTCSGGDERCGSSCSQAASRPPVSSLSALNVMRVSRCQIAVPSPGAWTTGRAARSSEVVMAHRVRRAPSRGHP